MLLYQILCHPVFTDMMFVDTNLQRNNKFAQVIASDFGWSHACPFKTNGEAHKALSLMFQHEGVPLMMVMDGSKEQPLGSFVISLPTVRFYVVSY